jgi:hypothetical protein
MYNFRVINTNHIVIADMEYYRVRLVYLVLALILTCNAFQIPPSTPRLRLSSAVRQSQQDEEQVRARLKVLTEAPPMTTESLEEFNRVDEETMARLKTKRAYVSILTEKLFQTIDDFQLKAASLDRIPSPATRERIVVLGSGWGSAAFLKTIDATKYEVTVISPRDHFLFTPMLAASAIGTVDFRSVIEPIRDSNSLANYVEATCDGVDVVERTINCQTVRCEGTSCEVTEFKLPYDHLIIAVGASVNTFGIKGKFCVEFQVD